MSDFLLELRSEEIPARMQKGARAELEKLFRREMDAAGVALGELTVWSTPRRLALIARDLPIETEAVSEEAKGPPEAAPDQAVDGFCRKLGLSRDQLEVRDIKGRPTYFAVINTPGRAVADVLAAAIPAIIRDFSWPKSQRWGAASISTESLRWVRPLSGIVALLGDQIVDCEVHGIKAGRETKGHRFHSIEPADPKSRNSGIPIRIRNEKNPTVLNVNGMIDIGSADEYAQKLYDAKVIVDHNIREDEIRIGALAAAKGAGLDLVEDEGLVVENAGLTEWPVPLLGRFEDDFLEVPPETIQLTARVNQKYFVCEKDGKLANAFICTANIEADDPAVVVEGNRKVLAARLSDAKFFWDVDRKKSLEEHAKGLERITFHEKLGTVADKVERVAKLARWLVEEGIVKDADPDQAEQAARLCKADLVTEMVGEFPELQGLMGGYYARAEGLDDAVADAIRDHYKPVGQGDDVPTAPVTVAVSLADKLDTIVGFFLIQEQPTGSKDPFALRRAALGVLSLITRNDLRLELALAVLWAMREVLLQAVTRLQAPEVQEVARLMRSGDMAKSLTNSEEILDFGRKMSPLLNALRLASEQGVGKASSRPRSEGKEVVAEDAAEIVSFFIDRLIVQQRSNAVSHDLVNAIVDLANDTDIVRLLTRVHALQAFMETEDGTNLLAGYKRASNILKKEEWTEAKNNSVSYTPETAEKALIDALDVAQPKAAAAIESEDFETAMVQLASLRAPVDAFFEDVTVNDDDADKRAARLDLLLRFRNAVHQVADFSRIEG